MVASSLAAQKVVYDAVISTANLVSVIKAPANSQEMPDASVQAMYEQRLSVQIHKCSRSGKQQLLQGEINTCKDWTAGNCSIFANSSCNKFWTPALLLTCSIAEESVAAQSCWY